MAQVWLTAREGPAAGAEIAVREEIVLGRQRQSGVRIPAAERGARALQ